MKTLNSQELAQIIVGNHQGETVENIESIYFDSRKIAQGSDGVFFALSGSQKNGQLYAQDAYDKGVRCFVLSNPLKELANTAQIIVEKPLVGLQTWAQKHRENLDFPIIGITGSNGKTVVKEWLYNLLWPYFPIFRSPKSYNSQIGVALSLLQGNPNHALGIIECGISTTGEMAKIEQMARPNIGLLTTVGSAHSQGFPSRDVHIKEKLALFKDAEVLIHFTNDEQLLTQIHNLPKHIQRVAIGKKDSDTIKICGLTKSKKGSEISLRIKNKNHCFSIPFKDKASVQNAIACFGVCYVLGVDLEEVKGRFSKLRTISMRLELLQGKNNCKIISDVFNSDIQSLEIALENLEEQAGLNKVLIVSDILQSQLPQEQLYKEVAENVNRHDLDNVLVVGEKISEYTHLFTAETIAFKDTPELIEYLNRKRFSQADILVKGARKFKLEKVVQKLEQKTHDTVLEVRLDAMVHNLNHFRTQLAPNTKLMVMVKALSYGTGDVEVAELLERQNVDYLGVAYTDEGIALRNAGIEIPIMVMNPEMGSHTAMLDHNLEPEIYSLRMANAIFDEWQKKASEAPLKVHIKINTGMNRLGFNEESLANLIPLLQKDENIKIASIFTHLATAGSNPDFALKQIQRFDGLYEKFTTKLGYKPNRHVLNTGGIIHHTNKQYEMVRLGIGLYGYNSDQKTYDQLRNVVLFKSVISQINTIETGEGVGYDQEFIADKTHKIATIPVGYADGLTREMGNKKAYVLIHKKKAKILGNVCMDMIMVDVTNIDCNEGDEVTLLGKKPDILEWSHWQQTIPYEILTRISSRVKRIYTQT